MFYRKVYWTSERTTKNNWTQGVMHQMKSLEKQFEELIISNVPKNINLALPVGQDIELKSILENLVEKVNENSKQIEAVRRDIFALETKMRRNDSYFKSYW